MTVFGSESKYTRSMFLLSGLYTFVNVNVVRIRYDFRDAIDRRKSVKDFGQRTATKVRSIHISPSGNPICIVVLEFRAVTKRYTDSVNAYVSTARFIIKLRTEISNVFVKRDNDFTYFIKRRRILAQISLVLACSCSTTRPTLRYQLLLADDMVWPRGVIRD